MYESEWPVALLLDEAWLRGRRALVTALEETGLWPEAPEQRAFLAGQRALGERLRETVLLPEISPDDRDWLMSPAIFAAANRRFRAHTPMSLAFGHLIGEMLQAGREAADPERARLCALFNFGISVFDLLHDALPELRSELGRRFNAGTLAGLQAEPEAAASLRKAAATSADPEIRLLLQLIAIVHERLSHLGDAAARAGVSDLLMRAYAAEMATATLHDEGPDRLRTSREKSTLPFLIMDAIARIGDDAEPGEPELASDLGRLFWLVDDLADLVGDTRSGAVNSVLVRAGQDGSADPASVLRSVLAGGTVEQVVQEIRDTLVRVCAALDAVPDAADRRGARTIPCYIRMWIE